MPIAEISKFVGGINNHIVPHLLPSEAATDMLNCNITSGSIEPLQSATSASPTVDGFASNQDLEGNRSIVKWGEEYFWSNNNSEVLESTLGYVGIESPSQPPLARPKSRGNRFIGKYQYVCTFETDDGYESAPFLPDGDLKIATVETESEVRTLVPATDVDDFNPQNYKYRKRRGYEAGARVTWQGRTWECIQSFSGEAAPQGSGNYPRYQAVQSWQYPGQAPDLWRDVTDVEVTVEGYDTIVLSNIPQPTENQVKYVNIYRTVANGGEFFLVERNEVGLTTYVDALPDSTLIAGNLLNLNQANQAPIYKSVNGDYQRFGGKYMTEVGGRFYLASGSRVYVSGQNNPHGWNPLNYREFEDTVTGMAKLANAVLVFTANRTYRISGATLEDAVQVQLPVQQGCPNWKTISYFRNRPVWQSYDGVCAYSPYTDREGEFVEIVTENRYDFTEQASFATANEDVYYLVFDNSEAVCIDFIHKSIYRRDFKAKWTWYDSDGDALYLSDGNSYTRLDGGSDLPWEYQTIDIALESLNELKDYRRIWLDNTANVTVEIYVDGTLKGEVLVRPDRKPVYLPKGTIGRVMKLRLKGQGTCEAIRIQYTKLR